MRARFRAWQSHDINPYKKKVSTDTALVNAQAFVSNFWAKKMEDYVLKMNLAIPSALLILCAVIRVVYIIWWRPKSLEKELRQQGIRGTSYKLLHGDMKEMKKSTIEALSKPMTLNHKIAPRVLPFFHEMFQKYGKQASFLSLSLSLLEQIHANHLFLFCLSKDKKLIHQWIECRFRKSFSGLDGNKAKTSNRGPRVNQADINR